MIISSKYRRKDPWIICFFLLLATVLVRLLSGGVGTETLLLHSVQILIVYLCIQIDKEKFLTRYVYIVVFLAAISVFAWLLVLANPEIGKMIFSFTTRVENKNGVIDYYNGLFFYTFSEGIGLDRNAGMYSEPGRYQGILEGALWILLIFREHIKISKKRVYLFTFTIILTIITSQSTAGYISLFAIILCYLFKGYKSDKTLFKMLVGIIVLIAVFFVWDFWVNGTMSLFSSVVTDKLRDTDIDVASSSGGARLRMMKICFDAMVEKPWGAGTISSRGNIVAAGFFTFFACYGIVSGIIVCYWIIYPLIKYHYSIAEIVTFSFVYINLGISQTYMFYPGILVIPVTIGYLRLLRKKNS